jgi:hypothetical protein
VFIALLWFTLFALPAYATSPSPGQLRRDITKLRLTVWRWQDDRDPPTNVPFRDDIGAKGPLEHNDTPTGRSWSPKKLPGGHYHRTTGSNRYLNSDSVSYLLWVKKRWQRIARKEYLIRKKYPTREDPTDARRALKLAFGGNLWEAITVSLCETGGRLGWATAGRGKHEFWGTMQMGTQERRLFGFSWTLLGQAKSAFRMWRVKGWRPWECMPGGGLRW